jgi:hypothetical protein
MTMSTEGPPSDQARRLGMKTQDQRLRRLAVDGAGISPWEADVLVDVVREVYFAEPADQPLRSGQMRCECVSADEGAGKPLSACQLRTVVLTVWDAEDEQVQATQGQAGLRRHRLLRVTEQAREQGGLLSQEDAARLLMTDVRTIRRDVVWLREKTEVVVATRGRQKDIGPGVSHRGQAIRHWLNGHEPVEVARRIHHSLQATERYIQHFTRVVFLRRKGFTALQIALTVGLSTASVDTYLGIYETLQGQRGCVKRFQELEAIGEAYYAAVDEKKGARSRPVKSRSVGRRP